MNTEQLEATLCSLLEKPVMVALPVHGTVILTFYGALRLESFSSEEKEYNLFHVVNYSFPFNTQVAFRPDDVFQIQERPMPTDAVPVPVIYLTSSSNMFSNDL